MENQTTLDLLTELSVDYAQGDHVGSPEPALDLLQVTSRSSPLSTS